MAIQGILDDGVGGSVIATLAKSGGDMNRFRPWVGKDGRDYIVKNDASTGRKDKAVPVRNAAISGLLRRDDWFAIDQAIVRAARARLRAVADLNDEGLTYQVPNGMGRTALVTETMSDISAAEISMSGLKQSQNDRPVFGAVSMPLPIVHKDFQFDVRQIMASRNGGSPLDTTMAELAGRMVAELVEQLYCGTASSYSYAGGSIYGLTNFPSRLLKTMTIPTGSNASSTLADVLAMRLQLQQAKHYGPYILYASLDWDQYLDNDYKATYNATSLRQRLEGIKGIKSCTTLDFLPANTMVLVQMTADVVRIVTGLEITTVQWETKGGMEQNFKVMCIKVPQLRADANGNTGICHGTHA